MTAWEVVGVGWARRTDTYGMQGMLAMGGRSQRVAPAHGRAGRHAGASGLKVRDGPGRAAPSPGCVKLQPEGIWRD